MKRTHSGAVVLPAMTSEPSDILRSESADVPLNLLESFQSYSVGLIGVRWRSNPSTSGTGTSIKTGEQRCGSGTLVRSDDRHFVLTAAHCARELAKWDEIGLVLTSYPTDFTIPLSKAIVVSESAAKEWGPDIAFFEIPPDNVAVVNNYTAKVFWNLDRHRAEMLSTDPKFNSGLWVLTGFPDVNSTVREANSQELKLMAYRLANVGWPKTNGGFDYVHVPMLGNELPATFGGMSGGGLWRADIKRNRDGSFAGFENERLEGCAFLQLNLPDICLVIRCHGRRSIYHFGLSSLHS